MGALEPQDASPPRVTSWNRLRAFWFGSVDVRPLALVRMTFSWMVLVAIVDVAPVLSTLLSDHGVLPRSALLANTFGMARLSVWDVAGPLWVTWVLWALTLLSAACLFVGWHTRVASIAAFVLVSGMHERNVAVFDGSDTVLRVMLFWFMFLPLGARWSIDAVLAARRGDELPSTTRAWPVRLAQLQFSWGYFCAVLVKWTGDTWRDGTALHYALSLPQSWTRTLGLWLDGVPSLSPVGTWGTLLVEGLFPFFVFMPLFQPHVKRIGLALGVALHVGIWFTMNVGNFSLVMIACYPLMFEPAWAQRIVDVVERRVPSWSRWTARVASLLERIWPLRAAPVHLQAKQRVRRVCDVVLTVLLALAMWFSFPVTSHVPPEPVALRMPIQFLALWQSWDMFAPNPIRTDVWLRGEGHLEDGTVVDVLRGPEHGFVPHVGPGGMFTRWSKYLSNLQYNGGAQLAPFAQFVCRRWSLDHPTSPLVNFQLLREQHPLPKPGAPELPWDEVVIWTQHCSEPSAAAKLPMAPHVLPVLPAR